MALSDIEQIYADAADAIGEIEITADSNHDVKPYSTCARHYPQARDEMIRGYNWNEATTLGLFLQDSVRPVHTWTYRFAYPADCLRPLRTSRPRSNWRDLGNYIYTKYRIEPESYNINKNYYAGRYLSVGDTTYIINVDFLSTSWTTDISNCTSKIEDYGYLEIEYLKKLPDPTSWSVDLRQAIVLNLATKIVIPITSDREKKADLQEELHRLVLPHSIAIDAMTGKPQQFFTSEWIDARGQ